MSSIKSWVNIPEDSDFTVENLPFGIFSTKNRTKRVGVAIGEEIIDLSLAWGLNFFQNIDIPGEIFEADYLNALMSLGRAKSTGLRNRLQTLLQVDETSLKAESENVLVKQSDAQMHMPVKVGDYTDFYSSIEHATNVGKMFRDPENALLPNWRHLPVGYHGRASSIYVSGTPIYRPQGQRIPPNATQPVFGPSTRLDFELEMAFVVCKENQPGKAVSTVEAKDYIFGMVLFNDWSARDIQKWEYVPLGPFLGKSFASSISPWVVTMDALEPFKVAGPIQEPEVLPYLKYTGEHNYDIDLQVFIQPENKVATCVSKSNYKYMYWNMAQQLAHHTINGCNLKVGDMMASGTISGKDENSYGSMLEISWSGKNPIALQDGSSRTFIEDGDTVIMKGMAKKDDLKVGFGEVRGTVIKSLS